MITRSEAIARPELGQQRYWYWRGWRIRYSYFMPTLPGAKNETPLLLIHGFGSSLEQWRNNVFDLRRDRPVYAIDLLGFGGSQKPGAILGAQLWQAQIFDFWQMAIQRPVILMGHSLGALVALTAAAQHPTMVERLIMLTLPLARQELISGPLEKLSRQIEQVFSTPLLMRPLFALVRQPWFIRKALQSVYRDPSLVDEQLLHAFVGPTCDRNAARTLCYLVKSRSQADFSASTQDLVRQISAPILLLWGTEDRVIPYQWADSLKDLTPNLTLSPINRGGHCFYDEMPEVLLTTVKEWIERS
jgi:pimeloyl-ACP methyl ester carboxylesterase